MISTKPVNSDELMKSCRLLQDRTIDHNGGLHFSDIVFDLVMDVFTKSFADAVTYRIYIGDPVMMPGEATFYRDGHMTMRISH